MFRISKNARVAIIGGGKFCKTFLQSLLSDAFAKIRPHIVGVADENPQAVGIRYAREQGIFTCADYRELLASADLDLIVEMTDDAQLRQAIKLAKAPEVGFLDHFEARTALDYLRLETEKDAILAKIQRHRDDGSKIEDMFEEFWISILEIFEGRNQYSKKIRKELLASERAMAQIIQGSTIPTFVINKDHILTHWNKACERLTGYKAEELVGSDGHWKPFRSQPRPIMADLILDGVDEEQVWRYYGTHWRNSALIEGAYEAEEYFAHLGKWLFFTAAPIKDPEGNIIGAIETLWDKTEDKKAEEQRERYTQELAESERALSQIIQGVTVPIFVLDQNHVITHWNRALENLSGLSSQQMVGTTDQWKPFYEKKRPAMADVILDQLPAEEIHQLYTNWRKSALIEGAYEAEDFFPNLGQDGAWCIFTAAPIKDPQGNIIGAIETLWDRTEQKKAEEEKDLYYTEIAGLCSIYTALNASLDLDLRIKAAMEEIRNFLSADLICIFLRDEDQDQDQETFYLRYSYSADGDHCPELVLTEADSIIYRVAKINEPMIYEDLPNTSDAQIGLLAQEGLQSLAYIPISTKDSKALGVIRIGSRQPYHFSREGKNILELIGNRIGIAIENSMLHEQFIRSEEKYRSLFNNDPNPIFILDSQTLDILDINERAEVGYGYAREELLGTSFLKLGDPDDEELDIRLANLSRDQSVLFSKKRHYRKGGQRFYVNINVSCAEYGEDEVLVATSTDVTESVERETQLIQASKMTTLGQMAAGIAHEINQPMNVIQVCADYLKKTIGKHGQIPAQDLKTLAADISTNVGRVTKIIRHMRDFARQSEVVRNKININDPIRDVFQVLGHQIKAHQIELEMRLKEDLPPIMAEHNRLEQVFINLVTNAIDAMDEKAARQGTQGWQKRLRIDSDFKNGHVEIRVSDTGVGMPPQLMDKIFEPFFTTKEVGKGTGLGVSISYGIVKDYDGQIEIDSTEGEGTTFKLKFPAVSSS